MSFRPVITDEVSRFMQPGRGVYVEGEDVEIDLVCCFNRELDFPVEASTGDTRGGVLCAGACFTAGFADGFT